MDPVGLSLEGFDATGAWRNKDNGYPIDSSGRLVDGTSVNDPTTLRNAILKRSDAFYAAFTRRLLTYALGRGAEYYDMPTVRAIQQDAAKHDNRVSSFILGIVKSAPFQLRRDDREPGKRSANSHAHLASTRNPGESDVHH
jgi:hypothetical protein